MPTTDPSISVTKSRELLQQTDKLIKTFPEVASVHGKIGRADTATDPAPLSMIETVVQLHTDPAQLAHAAGALLLQRLARLAEVAASRTRFWPEQRPITTERAQVRLDRPRRHAASRASTRRSASPASPTPGPTRSRTASTCSSTGIKTPVGIKILGPDLAVLGDARRAHRHRRADHRRHAQRLPRAHRRRLLPRLRHRPRRRRALRPHHRRRAGRDPDRHRRHERHHHRRRARALPAQRALRARAARRLPALRARAGRRP